MDFLLDPRVLFVFGLVLLAPFVVVGRLLWAAIRTEKAPNYASEDFFTNPDGSKGRFPRISDPASLLVSVIVPAYKEEKRISRMMDEMLAYLNATAKASPAFTWEIVIIDDGSKDNTAGLVQEKYVNALGTDKVRLLKLAVNNGKGGAVRKGMVRGRGKYLIMVDADGATKASDLGRLLEELRGVERDGLGIAIGSRAHLSDPSAGVSRTPLRRFLMWGFHTFIQLMIGGGGTAIKDTQCGFKMFTRASAALIFPVQHIDRWAFDVELLYLAARKAIPMVEVPVTWAEIDGSTMDLMSDAPKMARDIAAIRIAYTLGVWSENDTSARLVNNISDADALPSTPASAEKVAAPSDAATDAAAADAAAAAPGSGSGSRRRRHA